MSWRDWFVLVPVACVRRPAGLPSLITTLSFIIRLRVLGHIKDGSGRSIAMQSRSTGSRSCLCIQPWQSYRVFKRDQAICWICE